MLGEVFRYPKGKHRRREQPPEFKAYQSFKPYLRREFSRTCVFCRAHDGVEGDQQFAVEHYLPKEQHPALAADYSNLFYACARCNSFKGNWPYLRRGKAWVPIKGFLIPNPCKHVMAQHLWMDGGSLEVAAKSKDGEFTLDTLHLNERAAVRRKARALYQQLDVNRVRTRRKLTAIRKRLADKTSPLPPALEADLHSVAARLQRALDLAEEDFAGAFNPAPDP